MDFYGQVGSSYFADGTPKYRRVSQRMVLAIASVSAHLSTVRIRGAQNAGRFACGLRSVETSEVCELYVTKSCGLREIFSQQFCH